MFVLFYQIAQKQRKEKREKNVNVGNSFLECQNFFFTPNNFWYQNGSANKKKNCLQKQSFGFCVFCSC